MSDTISLQDLRALMNSTGVFACYAGCPEELARAKTFKELVEAFYREANDAARDYAESDYS